MSEFNPELLKNLYRPDSASHKGQNGKLLIIAGSTLFHAASLWPLTVASRILDMVFYASVPENNEIVSKNKEDFRNGIVVTRDNLDSYIKEADCVLIGPGLPRSEGQQTGDDDTRELTEGLLQKYPEKKWVIDGGSLQVIHPEILHDLKETAILTPHHAEYQKLFGSENITDVAKKYNVVVLLKGEVDEIASSDTFVSIPGGNAGMSKGGTGDVLAGLVGALYCKNDAFLSACAASYINKKAGESLEKRVGMYFNASDLADEIPKIMAQVV